MRQSGRRNSGRTVTIAFAVVSVTLVPPTNNVAAAAEVTPATKNAPSNSRSRDMSPRLAAIADLASIGRTSKVLAEAAGLPERGVGALQRDDHGRIIVDVTLVGSGTAALASLAQVGAEVIATDGGPVLATVAVPVDALQRLADLPTVAYVTEVVAPLSAGLEGGLPAPATPAGGAACATGTVSEGDVQLRADDLRAASGADGTGVLVGVVSDSFDNLGGAATDIADGELPGAANPCGRTTAIAVQSDLSSGGTDEGRAMLQIVHDLAPGAALEFATGSAGEVAMADQIRQLGLSGADIITDDITYLNEPMFQDGLIAQAIEQNRTIRGIPHFTAAGNSNAIVGGKNVASNEAPAFRPAACPAVAPSYHNACHDVDSSAGTDTGAGLTIAGGGSIILVLGWSEPMYGVTTDLDLYLVDTATDSIVASSELDNTGTKRASEYLSYANNSAGPRTYDVVIGRFNTGTNPSGTPRLRTVLVRSSGLTAVEYDTSTGGDTVGPTVFGHSAESTAISVAAVRYNTTSSPETFSSRGPASLCWEQVDGTAPRDAITPCASSSIDIAATDGAVNSFFGSAAGTTWRFYGSSAAAPHAAAVAAVLADARPCADADELESALQAGAAPIGSFGVDAVGAGLVDALAALNGRGQ